LYACAVGLVLGEEEGLRDLTEDNFYDVVMDTNVNVMVMFYSDATTWSKQYMPTYEKVAEVFEHEHNCVVAKLNVNKYRQLMKIYDYRAFMKFWFFPADSTVDGELYQSGRTLEKLVDFLNERCGTNRKYDGTLDTKKGRVETYDDLASTFIQTITNNTDNSTESTGSYYVHVMKKIADKGVGYVNEEMIRLHNILGGYLKTEKRKETITRLNILKHFNRLINNEQEEEEKTVEDSTESENDANKSTKEGEEVVKSTDDIITSALGGEATSGTIHKDQLKSEL